MKGKIGTTTQDANLFGTMYASFGDADNDKVNDLVEAILAVSPTVSDAYGSATISNLHFYNDGEMSYWGALAFANYLNSITYAGSNQWHLTAELNIVMDILDQQRNLTNVKNGQSDYYWTGQRVNAANDPCADGDIYIYSLY